MFEFHIWLFPSGFQPQPAFSHTDALNQIVGKKTLKEWNPVLRLPPPPPYPSSYRLSLSTYSMLPWTQALCSASGIHWWARDPMSAFWEGLDRNSRLRAVFGVRWPEFKSQIRHLLSWVHPDRLPVSQALNFPICKMGMVKTPVSKLIVGKGKWSHSVMSDSLRPHGL